MAEINQKQHRWKNEKQKIKWKTKASCSMPALITHDTITFTITSTKTPARNRSQRTISSKRSTNKIENEMDRRRRKTPHSSFNLERQRASTNTISNLKFSNQNTDNPREILLEIKSSYESFKKNTRHTLVALDFAKAVDTLRRKGCTLEALAIFNFEPSIINLVATVMQNIESCNHDEG